MRTRFAPSPTGYLHVGGARTALFNYLLAKKYDGVFVLRVEDTDQARSTDESVQAILDGMAWLGLNADEGPFFQTQRFDRYREVVQQLLDSGHAYHCYCTKEEVDASREAQKAAGVHKPMYDGKCRNRTEPRAGVDPVVRFRMPDTGSVGWSDLVKGDISWENAQLDDLVIQRSDGSPMYNLTVVVDDIDMEISHVIRGDDHESNTPKQIHIYQALGAELPQFGHLPMILGDDGKRLSKRHGAVSVMAYQEAGFLPEGLNNYLVRLGWSHGDQEIFTRDEMISLFSVEGTNKAASSFNTEKLRWVNQQHMLTADVARLADLVGPFLQDQGITDMDSESLHGAIALFRERAHTLVELADQIAFLFADFESYDEKSASKQLKAAAEQPLSTLKEKLNAITDWNPENIQAAIQDTVDTLEVGFGKVGQPLRVAVTGRGNAPGNDAVMALMPKESCLQRIDRALEFIAQRKAAAEARGS